MKPHSSLTFNPFSVAPLLGADLETLFVDRKEELARVNDFISFHERGVVLVVGDYGIGKTTFLLKLSHELAEHALVANMGAYRFDLDRIGFLRGILLTLLKAMKDKVKASAFRRLQTTAEAVLYPREETSRHHVGAGLLGLDSVREKEVTVRVTPNIYEVQEVLDEVLKESTKLFRRVVLVVDELDKALPEVASSLLVLVRTVFSLPGVFLIAVVSKGTMEYLGQEVRVTRSISDTEVVLGPLTNRDSIELVNRRLASAHAPGVTELFDGDALKAIADYSEGNPAALMNMCGHLFGVLLKEKRLKITYNDIVRVMDAGREGLLSQLPDREVRLLRVIEKRGRIRAGDAEIIRSLHVSRPRASQILRKLLQMEMLVRTREGKFVYYSVPKSVRPLIETISASE